MQQFWDERFGREEYVYGTEPNVFFKDRIDRLQVGSLLLPAEGEGRNAVYAASRGWEVSAVDFSRMAMQKAMALAGSKSVEIDYHLASLRDFRCHRQYDAIGLIFIHFLPGERRLFHHRMIECLAPGGTLIAELFHKDQLANGTGGPPSLEMLYTPEYLSEDFQALDIVYLEHEQVALKEGRFHSGTADVVRLVARKSPQFDSFAKKP